MISAVGITVMDHIMILDGFKDSEGTFHCGKYLTDGVGMSATASAQLQTLERVPGCDYGKRGHHFTLLGVIRRYRAFSLHCIDST